MLSSLHPMPWNQVVVDFREHRAPHRGDPGAAVHSPPHLEITFRMIPVAE